MNAKMFPVFFWLLATAVVGWIFLASRLKKVVKEKYPELGVIENSGQVESISVRVNARLTWYIISRNYKNVKDLELDRLGDGMLSLFYFIIVNFTGCVLLLLNS